MGALAISQSSSGLHCPVYRTWFSIAWVQTKDKEDDPMHNENPVTTSSAPQHVAELMLLAAFALALALLL